MPVDPFSKKFYDKTYKESKKYANHYSTIVYYPLFKFIVNNLKPGLKILDLGCGPGHLGHMIYDNVPFEDYVGIDFSKVAIQQAKAKAPLQFIEADLMGVDYTPYKGYTIISTEVFEHLDDKALIRRLPPNEIIFSVPNYMAENHHRTYDSEKAIKDYYKDMINIESIDSFNRGKGRIIFIIQGRVIHE
jgi:trans-aconitate methyltransferase